MSGSNGSEMSPGEALTEILLANMLQLVKTWNYQLYWNNAENEQAMVSKFSNQIASYCVIVTLRFVTSHLATFMFSQIQNARDLLSISRTT